MDDTLVHGFVLVRALEERGALLLEQWPGAADVSRTKLPLSSRKGTLLSVKNWRTEGQTSSRGTS
jgi:hypothetical protein